MEEEQLDMEVTQQREEHVKALLVKLLADQNDADVKKVKIIVRK